MSIINIDNIINLVTLTGLEIVLGIDNLIFIALIVQKLPENIRNKVRVAGLILALVMRVGLLFTAKWIIELTEPFFYLAKFAFSGRNIMLISGGGFLIIKSIIEIKNLFKENDKEKSSHISESLIGSISQIVFVDLVLSFDSIIAAVGISSNLQVMSVAIIIAMVVMLISSESLGKFIEKNSNIKTLALAFIGLVGVFLILSGLDIDIPKSYLYFAIFFSVVIEAINIMKNK